jgi:KUP system potassium uptake protein
VAKFGFMDAPDVPAALERARDQGLKFQADDTTYYLAHLTLFVHQIGRLGMMEWRDKLFVFLSRNARRATNFFQIPPDRVVEIGIQLEI